MENLRVKQLIREALQKPLKKDKCNCGCNHCSNVGNKGPVLNENIKAKIKMSDNMKYHVENKLSLMETKLKYGSKEFIDLWAEARYLYSRNVIHLNEVDKDIIVNTNLGEYGVVNGKKVPLDLYINEIFDHNKGGENGGKEDVEGAEDIYVLPYKKLLDAIERDYGKGDLYYEVEQALFDKNLDQVKQILTNYEADKEYLHLLDLNENEWETDSIRGNKLDVAGVGSTKMLPYQDLINRIYQDWGDNDLLHDIEVAIYDKDSDKITQILQDWDVYNDYSHLLNLNEIKINKPVSNHLAKLELLQQKIAQTKSLQEKKQYAIECAELVLPIWERFYPNDDRPRKSIEAAKRGDTAAAADTYAAAADTYAAAAAADTYAAAAAAADTAAYAAATDTYAAAYAAAYAATYAAYAAADTAAYAIRATKRFFKINESRIFIYKLDPKSRKIMKEYLRENQPTPIKEPDIKEPGTKEPPKPKRRTLVPDKDSPNPRPKAVLKETEKELVNKIYQRFKKLEK